MFLYHLLKACIYFLLILHVNVGRSAGAALPYVSSHLGTLTGRGKGLIGGKADGRRGMGCHSELLLKISAFSHILLAHIHYMAKPNNREEICNLPSVNHFKSNYNGQRHTPLVRK